MLDPSLNHFKAHDASMAGPLSDEMTACFVNNVSESEKTDLMRWMFATMGRHPTVADLALKGQPISSDASAKAGKVFVRLLTEPCLEETKAAIRTEDRRAALRQSLRGVSEAAMRTLITHPDVLKADADLFSQVDGKAIKAKLKP